MHAIDFTSVAASCDWWPCNHVTRMVVNFRSYLLRTHYQLERALLLNDNDGNT